MRLAAVHLLHGIVAMCLTLGADAEQEGVPTTKIVHQHSWRLLPSGNHALMRDGVQVGVFRRGEYLPRLAPGKFGSATLLPDGVEPPKEKQMGKVP